MLCLVGSSESCPSYREKKPLKNIIINLLHAKEDHESLWTWRNWWRMSMSSYAYLSTNIPTQLMMDHLIRSWIFTLCFIHNKPLFRWSIPPNRKILIVNPKIQSTDLKNTGVMFVIGNLKSIKIKQRASYVPFLGFFLSARTTENYREEKRWDDGDERCVLLCNNNRQSFFF